MFAELITELGTLASDAAGIGVAVVGLIVVAVGIGWVERIGGRAG